MLPLLRLGGRLCQLLARRGQQGPPARGGRRRRRSGRGGRRREVRKVCGGPHILREPRGRDDGRLRAQGGRGRHALRARQVAQAVLLQARRRYAVPVQARRRAHRRVLAAPALLLPAQPVRVLGDGEHRPARRQPALPLGVRLDAAAIGVLSEGHDARRPAEVLRRQARDPGHARPRREDSGGPGGVPPPLRHLPPLGLPDVPAAGRGPRARQGRRGRADVRGPGRVRRARLREARRGLRRCRADPGGGRLRRQCGRLRDALRRLLHVAQGVCEDVRPRAVRQAPCAAGRRQSLPGHLRQDRRAAPAAAASRALRSGFCAVSARCRSIEFEDQKQPWWNNSW
mmetsp:Transcript_12586/g.36707  ORF Transcript_12586/g.36707 Transcript_12586/m.36707 type:complete len:342 (+) Transcript_12586:958-1983(+)